MLFFPGVYSFLTILTLVFFLVHGCPWFHLGFTSASLAPPWPAFDSFDSAGKTCQTKHPIMSYGTPRCGPGYHFSGSSLALLPTIPYQVVAASFHPTWSLLRTKVALHDSRFGRGHLVDAFLHWCSGAAVCHRWTWMPSPWSQSWWMYEAALLWHDDQKHTT